MSQLSFRAWWHFLRAFLRNPQTRAVGLCFALCSWSFGSWVVHIPQVKTNLGLDEATLGWALFGLPLGQLFINPVAGRVVGRYGAARVCLATTLGTALTMCLPIFATNLPTLILGLALFGAMLALLGISMNACLAGLKLETGHSVMSTCHGMWSLGGVIGAGVASSLLSLGWSPRQHIVLAVALALAVRWNIAPTLRAMGRHLPEAEGKHGLARPSWPLTLLIAVAFLPCWPKAWPSTGAGSSCATTGWPSLRARPWVSGSSPLA